MGGSLGGLPKCLHMVWVLLILLYSLKLHTHNPLRHYEDAYWQPAEQSDKAMADTRHTCECVLEICLWLKATRRGEAFPDLVSPSGIPANRRRQTVISHLEAWKNGDHLTRKRKDFWTFNLPPPALLCHHNNCRQISWHSGDIQRG